MATKQTANLRATGPNESIETNFSIDWLSATVKHRTNVRAYNFLSAFDEVSARRECKPMHGYNAGYRWDFGAIMLWHTEKPAMGVHFILSAQCLAKLHEHQLDAMFLLQRFVNSYAKITMIHLALDIYNSNLRPQDVYAQIKQREYTGRARNASLIENLFGGATCYVGSWNSDRFYRLYDKAAEQSIEGVNWKRLELVLKGDYAHEFGYKFTNGGTLENANEVYRGTIKAMSDIQNDEWKQILSGKANTLSLPKFKVRKTREWLLTQVVPAMARYVIESGDDKLINDFAAEFDAVYQKVLEKFEREKI